MPTLYTKYLLRHILRGSLLLSLLPTSCDQDDEGMDCNEEGQAEASESTDGDHESGEGQTEAEGLSCDFRKEGPHYQDRPEYDPACRAIEDPEACSTAGCRPVFLSPIRCTDAGACVEPEEFWSCEPMPPTIVCKPHDGVVLCKFSDDGGVQAAYLTMDGCGVSQLTECGVPAGSLLEEEGKTAVRTCP